MALYSCSQYIQIQNDGQKNFSNSSAAFAERTIIKKGRKGEKREGRWQKRVWSISPIFRENVYEYATQYIYVSFNTNPDVVFLQMYPLRPLIDPWFWAQTRGQSICLGHPLEKCTIIQLQLTRFSSSEYCKILLDKVRCRRDLTTFAKFLFAPIFCHKEGTL